MSAKKRDISREEMRQYLDGNLKGKAAHEVERHLLENEFANEAMEGFDGWDQHLIDADIQQLQDRVASKKRRGFFYYVAASVALLIIAVSSVWFLMDWVNEDATLTYEEQIKQEIAPELNEPEKQEEESFVPPITREVENKPVPKPEVTTESRAKKEAKHIIAEVIIDQEMDAEEVILLDEEPVLEEVLIEQDNELLVASGEVQNEIEYIDFDTVGNQDQMKGTIAGDKIPMNNIMSSRSINEQLNTEKKNFILEKELEAVIAIDTNDLENALAGKAAGLMITDKREVASESMTNSLSEIQQPKIMIRGYSSISDHDLATVSGQITDESGEPLPGVNVVIKGTSVGTISDIDGNYSIARMKGFQLNFSFIGMESTDITMGDQSEINVVLESDVQALSEVVVTSYGGTKEEEQGYQSARPEIGMAEYKDYLERNLQYPEEAKERQIEGKVVLKLTINSLGEITEIDVKRNLGFGCDEEAIRLVKEGPNWLPAEKGGANVEGSVRVKVRFELED